MLFRSSEIVEHRPGVVRLDATEVIAIIPVVHLRQLILGKTLVATDVAVIAMGGMVVSKSIKTAGDECDAAISDYIKKKFNMVIGDTTAENLKVNIGNKETMNEDNLIEVKGRNLLTGLPMHIFITINDIMEAISRPINEIVETVHFRT